MRVLRKFPFTTNIIIAIFVLCFINVPDTPLQNISLIDKWTHIILYLCLGVCIALEYFNAYGYSGAKETCIMGVSHAFVDGWTHRNSASLLYWRKSQW